MDNSEPQRMKPYSYSLVRGIWPSVYSSVYQQELDFRWRFHSKFGKKTRVQQILEFMMPTKTYSVVITAVPPSESCEIVFCLLAEADQKKVRS